MSAPSQRTPTAAASAAPARLEPGGGGSPSEQLFASLVAAYDADSPPVAPLPHFTKGQRRAHFFDDGVVPRVAGGIVLPARDVAAIERE
jgi:hypothetical protein